MDKASFPAPGQKCLGRKPGAEGRLSITAVRTSAMPLSLEMYLPMVGNLPAGGLSYMNKQLNGISK